MISTPLLSGERDADAKRWLGWLKTLDETRTVRISK